MAITKLANKGVSRTEGVIVEEGLWNETLAADTTLDEEDVGKVIKLGKSGLTITLPATVVGYVYTLVYDCDTKAGTVAVSPNANDKIMGVDITDADNKDLDLSNGSKGDMVQLIGDGSLGWYVTKIAGTWTRET